MQKLGLIMLALMLIGSTSWGQELTPEAAEIAEATLSADSETATDTKIQTDTLGLGTEGYGSPVRSDRIMSGEIVGTKSGYAHPFLSIGGFHTDNLFQTANNEESDWVTVITPGIWFALPASRQRLVQIETMNTAPGGLALSRFRTESERRFQGYALYRADIREYDKYTDENRVDHRAEGSFKVSLRGGLSLELLDVYEVDHDPYGTGGMPDRRLDKFKSNLFNTTLAYRVTPKVLLQADYGHYSLDYDSDLNAYRDRDDDTVSAYIYYRLTPKTSLFTQVEYISIDYDQATNSDSDELNYYLGAQMRASSKIQGRVRFGYGEKDYDEKVLNDRDEWLAEAQIDYFITPKTSIYLKGSRRVLESDTNGTNNILAYSSQFGYRQRVTSKLRGEAALYYVNNEYDDATTIGTQTAKRDDDEYGFIASLGFSISRWLNISVGYEYQERDSNFNSEDYTSNSFFLRLTAAL